MKGVDKIPKHWEKKKFRWDVFFQEGPGLRSYQFTTEGIRVICVSNITENGIDFTTTHTRHISSEEYLENYTHFTVHDGDILLSSSGSIGKVSRYWEDGEPVILNTSTIRLNSIDPETFFQDFIPYVLKSEYVQLQLRFLMTGGVVNNFGPTHLDQLYHFVPPLPEQKKIVSFLDDKTSKIDRLIQSKQRKIKLLKEKQTSLINEIVTKGLKPDVEMKDSGVEWIGEIPSHWVHSKLGFYTTKIGSGSTPRGGSEVYVNSGIPFIRSQNVHFTGLNLSDVSYITPEIHESMGNTIVHKNDVLLNITGGSIGRCCIVNEEQEMNVNQHVSILRTKESVKPDFLNYLLSSDVGQLQVFYNVSGGNREGLTIEGISDFRITIPPLKEQEEIVEYLNTETQTIDKTVNLEKVKIDLLKEYKQSLISEVVTGKINVQEEVDEVLV